MSKKECLFNSLTGDFPTVTQMGNNGILTFLQLYTINAPKQTTADIFPHHLQVVVLHIMLHIHYESQSQGKTFVIIYTF